MLLKAIKKSYTRGNDNLHAKHNKAIAHIWFLAYNMKNFKT